MPKITGGISAAIVAVLVFTGCAAATPERVTPADETTAPLVAETPAVPEAEDAEIAFLAAVREALPANTQIPDATDEQLLVAGARACTEIAAGADTLTLSLIEGEQVDDSGFYPDSAQIIIASRATICG